MFKPIILWPDPVLKTPAVPVTVFDDRLKALIADLWQTVYEAKGAGLAAPQIGVSEQVLVVDVSYENPDFKPVAMVNPRIVQRSVEQDTFNEACLSMPGQSYDVARPKSVTVEYKDETGKALTLEAEGVLATALQHEIDHLNGIVYVDHLSPLKRDMARKKAEKLKRSIAASQKRRDFEIERLKTLGVKLPSRIEKER